MRHVIFSLILILATAVVRADNPKREFRGAWIHTVGQGQYAKQSTKENQAYLISLLDKLQAAGVNAVVFQVRPQADAFYKSEIEPWSRFLSGTQGVAPKPEWDPLKFMVDQCHARGMELHAWLNPYRVTSNNKEVLAKNHPYHKHPERFLRYGKQIYFDPGLPENRAFICSVVSDIINRYDIDAVHMDDYFYPYPIKGEEFPDSKSFKKYGNGKSLDDWRRENVNLLIRDLHNTIAATKPWVRFGISPFGVWRNKKEDPNGSDTNALTNYGDLYADVTLWTRNGWVDYMMPQLYWELEHARASTAVLAHWWNDNANGRHMYFGQSVNNIMDHPDLAPSTETNQLRHKIELSRSLDNVQGNCWWPGYSITRNYKGVADLLANDLQSTPAIVPAYTWIDDIAPDEVLDLTIKGRTLSWKRAKATDPLQQQRAFVIYHFPKGKVKLDRADAIVAITYDTSFILPDKVKGGTVVVTALDPVNNESPKGISLKLK